MNSTATLQRDEDIYFENVIQHFVKNDSLFVERNWLTNRIKAAIDDPSSRFILVTGDPGIGKTTLLAELAHLYPDSLRYFLRIDTPAPYRSGTAQSFLNSIGVQLASRDHELFQQHNLETVVHQRIRDVTSGGTVIGL